MQKYYIVFFANSVDIINYNRIYSFFDDDLNMRAGSVKVGADFVNPGGDLVIARADFDRLGLIPSDGRAIPYLPEAIPSSSIFGAEYRSEDRIEAREVSLRCRTYLSNIVMRDVFSLWLKNIYPSIFDLRSRNVKLLCSLPRSRLSLSSHLDEEPSSSSDPPLNHLWPSLLDFCGSIF